MYRPKGWDRLLRNEIEKIPDSTLMKGDVAMALLLFAKAGADAMLVALRNNQLSPFDKRVMQANFKGKIVIIPEEEK